MLQTVSPSVLWSQRTTWTSRGGEGLQMLQLLEMLKANQTLRSILTHCKSLFINSRWVLGFDVPPDRIAHLCVRKGCELPPILMHLSYGSVWESVQPVAGCGRASISAPAPSTPDTPALQAHRFLGLILLIWSDHFCLGSIWKLAIIAFSVATEAHPVLLPFLSASLWEFAVRFRIVRNS